MNKDEHRVLRFLMKQSRGVPANYIRNRLSMSIVKTKAALESLERKGYVEHNGISIGWKAI